jgi:hypothetical protein
MKYEVTAENIDWDVGEQDVCDRLSSRKFHGVFADGFLVSAFSEKDRAIEFLHACDETGLYNGKSVYIDDCDSGDLSESDWNGLVEKEIATVRKSLPVTMTVEVEADSEDDAIDFAVDQMSEDAGWLINGAERYKVTKKEGGKK